MPKLFLSSSGIAAIFSGGSPFRRRLLIISSAQLMMESANQGSRTSPSPAYSTSLFKLVTGCLPSSSHKGAKSVILVGAITPHRRFTGVTGDPFQFGAMSISALTLHPLVDFRQLGSASNAFASVIPIGRDQFEIRSTNPYGCPSNDHVADHRFRRHRTEGDDLRYRIAMCISATCSITWSVSPQKSTSKSGMETRSGLRKRLNRSNSSGSVIFSA